MTDLPWRGKQFSGGYSAEYRPVGQHSFRFVKERGKPKVFPTVSEAIRAAQDAFLATLDGQTRATLPFDASRAEKRLSAEAEDWLRSSRQDVKAAHVNRQPGRKPFQEIRGRARVG